MSSTAESSNALKNLLDELIWLYVQNLLSNDFKGAESNEALSKVLVAVDERCMKVLKKAGVISSHRISMVQVTEGTELLVDVEISPNVANAAVHSGDDSSSSASGVS